MRLCMLNKMCQALRIDTERPFASVLMVWLLMTEREEKERLAQEEREREEREYAEKLAKLEAQAERQRQREREIEERQRQKNEEAFNSKDRFEERARDGWVGSILFEGILDTWCSSPCLESQGCRLIPVSPFFFCLVLLIFSVFSFFS